MIRVDGDPIERTAVTEIKKAVTKKRGRPRKAVTLSNAERQRAYRERKKAA